MDVSEALSGFPAGKDAARIEIWTEDNLAKVHNLPINDGVRASFSAIDGHTLNGAADALLRFSNATALCDWACYAAPEDRADIPRLQAVIAAFPAGFRLWFCRVDGQVIPVGYTGWYPISEAAFVKAFETPERLENRGELWPQALNQDSEAFVWLFNYSIIAGLRRSPQSKRMLEAYANDLAAIKVGGMAAAVLSQESKRVVARFGMTYRGRMTHLGASEDVYTVRS